MRKVRYSLTGAVELCSWCGKRILMCGHTLKGRIPFIMERKKVCFECAYWSELAKYPKKNMEVTGTKCIIINPLVDKDVKKDKSLLLGGKGKKRFFMRADGTLVISNDIWTIGEIPEQYRPLFKRTIYEITSKAHNMLMRFNKRCKARGCYDRHYCLRYDTVEADDDSDVPKNWKKGGEQCPSFMDKTKYIIE